MSAKVRVEQFCRRLQKLYTTWNEHPDGAWSNITSFAILSGVKPEALLYLKSISLQLWLFGLEIPDSLIVFGKKTVHVVTSQKKIDHLQVLAETCLKETSIQLEFVQRPKYSDNAEYLSKTLEFIRSAGENFALGILPKEKHAGKLADDWVAAINAMQDNTVDMGPAIAALLACKEEEEVVLIKKAAYLACRVGTQFVVAKLERCMEESLDMKHSELSRLTEKVVVDPRKHGIKLLPENCDIAFEPLFQSGGGYEVKLGMPSDDRSLKEGCIVMMLGTRYDSYCATVGRCFFVDAPNRVKDEYNALLSAEEAAIRALTAGSPLKAVREAVVRALNERNMGHLAEKLSKSVGYLMGTELRDSFYNLNDKNKRVIRPRMVFHLSLLVTGLEWENEETQKRQEYCLFLMDTVCVAESGQEMEVLTSMCKKEWSDISYFNERELEEPGTSSPQQNPLILEHRLRRKDGKSEDEHLKENHRKAVQSELEQAKNKETLERLTGVAPLSRARRARGRSVMDVEVYKHIRDIPPSRARQQSVQIDRDRECVLLPLFGLMVPFHVMVIRNIISQTDGERAYIRINFNHGGAYEPSMRHPDMALLKEVSFRTTNVHHASQIVQEVKTLRTYVLNRDKERAERATLVQQEDLARGKRVFRLPDLWVRPSLGVQGRKMSGILEAHQNGFRYFAPKGAHLDVMYKNIRFAFFQPASKELLTILHFQLVDPIMVGKRKTSYVQFYTEISDVVQTVEGNRRSAFDPDEIEEEVREKERVLKINQEFQLFVKRVQEHWSRELPEAGLEFDVPFRELGFYGVPHKSNVFLMPTVNCLVELTEMPPTVVPIEDVEIVNLERIGFNLKNFDVTIVFKDFERDVLRIDTVPSSYLDNLKEWFTSVKLKYYETKMNLAWRPILKNIMDDPQAFFESGGWSFLDMEASDDESNEEPEADSEFEPSDESGEDESMEESNSESASLVDSDETMEGSDEEEEEADEPGLTWDELEAEAKKDDRRFEHSDSDSEYRKQKRMVRTPRTVNTDERGPRNAAVGLLIQPRPCSDVLEVISRQDLDGENSGCGANELTLCVFLRSTCLFGELRSDVLLFKMASSSEPSSPPDFGIPPLTPILPAPPARRDDPPEFVKDPPPRWFFMDDEVGRKVRVLIPSHTANHYTRTRVVHACDAVEYGYYLYECLRRNAYGEVDPTQSPPVRKPPVEVEMEPRGTKRRRAPDDRSPCYIPDAEVDDDGWYFGLPWPYGFVHSQRSNTGLGFGGRQELGMFPWWPFVPAHLKPLIECDLPPSERPWNCLSTPYQKPKPMTGNILFNADEGPSDVNYDPAEDPTTEAYTRRYWHQSVDPEKWESTRTVFRKYEFEEWYPTDDIPCERPRGKMFIKRPGKETIVMDEKYKCREFRSLTEKEAEIVDALDAMTGYSVPRVVGESYRVIPVKEYSPFRPSEPRRRRLNDGTWQPAGVFGIAWSFAKRVFNVLTSRVQD